MNAHIEKMAREAGFYPENGPGLDSVLEAFAKAIAEDCAKVADSYRDNHAKGMVTGSDISQAIRERYK